MKKYFLLPVVFLVLLTQTFGCYLSQPHDITTSPIESSFISSLNNKTVVLLDNLGDHSEKLSPVCSGVWISPHQILTAAHCIAPAALTPEQYETIGELVEAGVVDLTGFTLNFSTFKDYDSGYEMEDQLRKSHVAIVVKMNQEKDLALITTKDASDAWAEISTDDTFVGEPVVAVGHPAGLLYSFSQGFVSSKERNIKFADSWKNPTTFVQATTTIWFGNSGGSLFNSEGKVVGIASRMIGKANHLGLWVSHIEIIKFLNPTS